MVDRIGAALTVVMGIIVSAILWTAVQDVLQSLFSGFSGLISAGFAVYTFIGLVALVGVCLATRKPATFAIALIAVFVYLYVNFVLL